MSQSLDQEPNKVVMTISRVHRSPAQPWVKLITISVQNSLDDTDTFNNNNSDDIPGYKESSELEEILQNIITHLRHSYHIQGINILEGEE